jgi:heme exporter protein CcmD
MTAHTDYIIAVKSYTLYISAAYGITFVVLAGMIITTLLAWKKVK